MEGWDAKTYTPSIPPQRYCGGGLNTYASYCRGNWDKHPFTQCRGGNILNPNIYIRWKAGMQLSTHSGLKRWSPQSPLTIWEIWETKQKGTQKKYISGCSSRRDPSTHTQWLRLEKLLDKWWEGYWFWSSLVGLAVWVGVGWLFVTLGRASFGCGLQCLYKPYLLSCQKLFDHQSRG